MSSSEIRSENLQSYYCKIRPLSGHNFSDVLKQSRHIFRLLEKRTKRRPYVRSAYFQKDKIFFDFFWEHLQQKIPAERFRRLRFLPCALDLLRYGKHHPLIIKEAGSAQVLLHRFAGHTADDERFYVQIKHDIRSGKKQLISIFPAQRK